MNTRYKSKSMGEVLGSYQGPDVDERTKRMIFSGLTNPIDVYKAALEDLKDQERRLNEIGREHLSGPVRLLYRLTDRWVGVTAFDFRVRKQLGALMQAKQALESKLNRYKELSESSREELRDFQKVKRGARLLRSKYLSMQGALLQREQELLDRMDELRAQVAKAPEDYSAMEEVDRAEAELDDYREDLDTVAHEKSLATSKFVNTHFLIDGLRQNKLQLDSYMRALRQKYFSSALLESRLAAISKQGLDPVGTMEVLVGASEVSQKVESFTDAATQVQLEGVQGALSLPQEEFAHNGRVSRSLQGLERKSKLFDNDLEDLAERILEEERRR